MALRSGERVFECTAMDTADDDERSLPKVQIKCARDPVHGLMTVARKLLAEEIRIREAVNRAHEVLRRNPSPDTFLGRQHHALIPLPHQKE